MLRSAKDLENCAIRATDGIIGRVKDFFFDDHAWVVRYLVVETGAWLSSRRVLILPRALGQPDWAEKILPVSITKEQVRNSPDIDTDKPVSRQHEIQYLEYYQCPVYWTGEGLFALGCQGAMPMGSSSHGFDADYRRAQAQHDLEAAQAAPRQDDDPHLRSGEAVTGYHIHASDGEIGHLQGMLVEEGSWAIRYLIVNTSNWWLGHQVLIAPEWITDVSWLDRTVMIDLTRQAIQEAPPYDPALLPDRPKETLVHEHYGRNGYWQRAAPQAISARMTLRRAGIPQGHDR